jgi:uncharacterized membrane protein YkoI
MSKRPKKILAGVGLLAAFGLGGAAIAAAQGESGNDRADEKGKATETDQTATGPDATRAGQAALQSVGGGKVLSVEKKTPEQGAEKHASGEESAKERAIDQKTVYAVQVQKSDGTNVDVALDAAFNVLDTQKD